jgi:hypothetical protein
MRRIISKIESRRARLPLLLALGLMLLVSAGCSKKYEHKRLAADSPEQARIVQLLAAVREARAAGLDSVIARDGVAELNAADRRRLAGSLAALAQADRVELLKADRFGRDICRATFQLTSGTRVRSISVLLKGEPDQLRWLQPN